MCLRVSLQLFLFSMLALPTPTEVAQSAELVRFAAAVKPTPDELRWQKIPWLTDLAEGQRVARAESRPIVLWVTGDDPLERC